LVVSVRCCSGRHSHADRGTLTHADQDKYARPNQSTTNTAASQSNHRAYEHNHPCADNCAITHIHRHNTTEDFNGHDFANGDDESTITNGYVYLDAHIYRHRDARCDNDTTGE
jgi:hypothetical protein